MNEVRTIFAERLRNLRLSKNLTGTELAAVLGATGSAVRMWETGQSKPTANTLIELTKALNCSSDYLLGISEHNYYTADQEAYAKLYGEFEAYKKKVYKAIEKATISLSDTVIDFDDLTR